MQGIICRTQPFLQYIKKPDVHFNTVIKFKFENKRQYKKVCINKFRFRKIEKDQKIL